jgi:acetylornithine aminotransferase
MVNNHLSSQTTTTDLAAQSHIFPSYSRFPFSPVKGKGSYLWDASGRQVLDFVSGIGVTNLGHVPDTVLAALHHQLDELWHVSNLYPSAAQEQYARLLTDHSIADYLFFCNSGAEANEAAIKLTRRYHQKVLHSGRYEIITLTNSFHGRTLATLTATGQDKVKDGFDPLPEGFVYAPMNDKKALWEALSDWTAAIMIETLQGEGGLHEIDPDYLATIKQYCAKYGILLIVDEVQTGMGRTGKLFSYEHYDIEPDIITMAKGIGSGFPMGVMGAKAKLRDAFTPGTHGSTFGGTFLAMAAAQATLETMLAEDLPARAASSGEYLMTQLRTALAGNDQVVDIRGRGLLVGIECKQQTTPYIEAALAQNLLVLGAGPNVIRLLPNLRVTRGEIDTAVAILADVIR